MAEEPLDQATGCAELAADDGGAQRETAGTRDLAQKLGAPVQVFGIGSVCFRVLPFAAGEDTIGADMDQADAASAAQVRQAMRKERIDAQAD